MSGLKQENISFFSIVVLWAIEITCSVELSMNIIYSLKPDYEKISTLFRHMIADTVD